MQNHKGCSKCYALTDFTKRGGVYQKADALPIKLAKAAQSYFCMVLAHSKKLHSRHNQPVHSCLMNIINLDMNVLDLLPLIMVHVAAVQVPKKISMYSNIH